MGTKMFFIQEGIVDIIMSDGEVATSLSDGSYFGGEDMRDKRVPKEENPILGSNSSQMCSLIIR